MVSVQYPGYTLQPLQPSPLSSLVGGFKQGFASADKYRKDERGQAAQKAIVERALGDGSASSQPQSGGLLSQLGSLYGASPQLNAPQNGGGALGALSSLASGAPVGGVTSQPLQPVGQPQDPASARVGSAFDVTAPGSSKVIDAGPGWTAVDDGRGDRVVRKGSRNWRNNNPGNIEYGDFAKSHGAIGTDGRFAVFPSYDSGRSAKESLLFESGGYKDKTIAGAIARYAPPSENNTGAYIGAVASAAGVSPTTRLADLNPQQRGAMLDAMQKVEGFKQGSVMAYDGGGGGVETPALQSASPDASSAPQGQPQNPMGNFGQAMQLVAGVAGHPQGIKPTSDEFMAMLGSEETRPFAMALWKANVTKAAPDIDQAIKIAQYLDGQQKSATDERHWQADHDLKAQEFGAKPPTVVDQYDPETGAPRKMIWNPQTRGFEPFGGAKAPGANNGITVSPDGTVTIGGKVPTGFEPDPNNPGAIKPIPGGPGTQLPAEVAGRIGLADSFMQDYPKLRQSISNGDVTGAFDRGMAGNNSSSPQAQIMRQIQSGTDALQRMLTGAGMPASEAEGYARRYLPTYTDDAASMTQKIDQLKKELLSVRETVMRGRGGASSDAPAGGGNTGSTSTGLKWSVQ